MKVVESQDEQRCHIFVVWRKDRRHAYQVDGCPLGTNLKQHLHGGCVWSSCQDSLFPNSYDEIIWLFIISWILKISPRDLSNLFVSRHFVWSCQGNSWGRLCDVAMNRPSPINPGLSRLDIRYWVYHRPPVNVEEAIRDAQTNEHIKLLFDIDFVCMFVKCGMPGCPEKTSSK